VKAVLLLADAAQVADGKLYLLGAGWSVTGPGPMPSAVAVKIEVPWTETNVPHHFDLELLTEDGGPVTVPSPDGQPHPVQAGGDFEVGRPPGLRPGTPIDMPLAVSIGPLPLPPDRRFTWRLTIDGQSHEDWQASFNTRPLPPGMTMDIGEG
jgi:hypothetical protein